MSVICMYVLLGHHTSYMYGVQRTVLQSQFSPSITWVLGIELQLSGLTVGAFTHGTLSLVLEVIF